VRLSTHTAQAFANAPCRTRLVIVSNLLSVDLAVAIRVEQLQVLQRVVAAVASPLAMVDVPLLLHHAEELTAHRASSLLLSP